MYGIEVVEVLNISVQEIVMIEYGDGRTHVFHHFGLKWYGFQLLCIAYYTYYVGLEVTFIFQNTSVYEWSSMTCHGNFGWYILKCFIMYPLLCKNGEMEKFNLGRYERI